MDTRISPSAIWDDLLRRIAASSNPLAEIDRLKSEINPGFVEYLNRATGQLAGQNRLADALRINEWALRAVHHLRHPLLEAHTLFNRAQLERNGGNVERSGKTFREALQLYQKHGAPLDILDATAGLLEFLAAQHKDREMEEVAASSLDKVLATGQLTGELKEPLVRICRTLRGQAGSRMVKTYLDLLLQMAEQLGDREGEADAAGMLAGTYFDADLPQAKRLCQRALDLHRQLNNAQMQALDLGDLGHACYRLGELEDAARYYTECIAIRDREGHTTEMHSDLYRLYHVLHYLGRRREALQVYTRMMELTTGSPSAFQLTPVMYNLFLDEHGQKLEGIKFGRP